ncbi:hypothetical protein FF38_08777 [Lucilia cuprina]|uniref:Gustatory receptor n=1 Tax=Lucilia cuprina TaxID=7375 RepID=A0A0L0CN08_LUCCU|nr:hypothetical protein FF38_08777 [Lucilia cuprina]
MYLYYVMCDRLCETMKETDNIILEYSTRSQNNEVERFILGRLMLRPKINICGMFVVDLNSFLLISYFDRFPNVPRNQGLRKFLYFNTLLMFYHVISMFSSIWTLYFKGDFWNFLNIYIVAGAICMQHLIMLHHASLLCYMYESLSQLHYQLIHDILDPKLSLIHFHICTLMTQLNVIFNPVNLWIQLCLLLTNSMAGYVTVVNIAAGRMDLDSYTNILGSSLYLLLCLHMYLYFMLCEWVTVKAKKTSYILKEFSVKSYSQEFEKMSLSCSVLPVSISIYDMFNINLQSFFTQLSQTLLYTILLIQIDAQHYLVQ